MTRKSPVLLTSDQDQLLRAELVRLAVELQPITVRGLYYQAVISALLDFIKKDTGKSKTYYKFVQTRCLDLRRAGAIPWDFIVDESRPSTSVNRFDGPVEYAGVVPHWYDLDYWRDQIVRPLVLIEKQGQLGVFLRHAHSFGADVAACKGYGSVSQLKDIAKEVDGYIRNGQYVELIVCADFDPSGCDWPRAAVAEIREHVSEPWKVDSRRVLVTPDDLDQLGPAVALRAPNGDDPRIQSFLDENGFDADQETCVEMDALNPNEARERVEQVFTELFDGDIQEQRDLEQEHRQKFTEVLAGLESGPDA